jgi:uncharacterized protein YkwD
MRAADLSPGALAVALAVAASAAAAAPGTPAGDDGARRAPAPRVAGSYGAEPTVALTPNEERALAVARARLGAPRVSAALVLAARELAALSASGVGDPLARRRLRAALARAGAPDPAPAAVLVVAPGARAADALARALPRTRATHFGAGAVERDGSVHVVLVASERRVRLAPFPREVAPGAIADLSGALEAGLVRPRVFVTLPSGDVREARTSGARELRARLSFPTAGRYAVEVLADGAGGPEVAALLTVSAGGAPLEAPPRAAAPPEPADDAGAEAAVVRAVDALRRRHGLPSLAAAPELAEVARRHSRAMAAAGTVAHVLPGSGDLAERLRRAGVPWRRAYENVARAASALGAHETVEESPAHLANLLRPDATRVGVGIARARLPSGDPTVYLTEVLVGPVDDGAESRLTPDGRAREAIWRERARLALPPLTADPALEALAREAAVALHARDDTDPPPDLGARALALRRGLAAVDVFVASGPGEVTASSNLRDARFKRVGVGIASGDSGRYGAARLFVVVVYTD